MSDAANPAIPTSGEMLDRVDRGWESLLAVVARADDERLSRPGEGGWSAKDHLAHLAAWEGSLLALLNGTSRAAGTGVDEGLFEASGVDGVNQQIHERTRGLPPGQIVANLRQSHERLRARLATLTDDDLAKPYSHYQPHDPPDNADPVVGWIAGDTWEHYEEHLATINALLATAD